MGKPVESEIIYEEGSGDPVNQNTDANDNIEVP